MVRIDSTLLRIVNIYLVMVTIEDEYCTQDILWMVNHYLMDTLNSLTELKYMVEIIHVMIMAISMTDSYSKVMAKEKYHNLVVINMDNLTV